MRGLVVVETVRGREVCAACGGNVHLEETWLGEDENGCGRFLVNRQCESCNRWSEEVCFE